VDRSMADIFYKLIIGCVCLRPRAMEEQSLSKIRVIARTMAKKQREKSYSRHVARSTIKRIQGCTELPDKAIDNLIEDICRAHKDNA
jgi:hypothetical protein